MHPRHRKHGSEKGTAFGGGVPLEPSTKNLVEVCGIAERAVLDGRLFLFLLSAREKWMDGTIRNTGAEGLLEILCCGLERDAEQRTANRLGDRSRYVGLSDIAKMLDCPRAALAAKLCTTEHRNTAEALKH